jgi:phenylpropionate dioxygenase-like ring-hydroxylating dioxygenase large terminal subunit
MRASSTPEEALASFHNAANRRQQTRAAGLHPDYWYAVEHEHALKPGMVVETGFWGRSIALFRGEDGVLRAIENRCAHRQVKLSLGGVDGTTLTCPYHGWSYDGDGCLARVPHELFGRKLPRLKIASFPLRVRYGLIWLFPGDPALADRTPMPEIPELEGKDAWAYVPLDFTWRAHHSMLIENVSDFTHAHLHRKYRPFSDAKLIDYVNEGDKVRVTYDTLIGDGPISRLFIDRKRINVNRIELCFDYPYQWSNTDDKIKHWCFVLPIAPNRTRAFFLFYFKSFRIPLTPLSIPRGLMKSFLQAANRIMIRPLLSQDGWMVEAEQEAYEAALDAQYTELNPTVIEFQKVIVKRWHEYVARVANGAGTKADAADTQADIKHAGRRPR